MPILVLLLASVAAGKDDPPRNASSRCGSYCLYVALRALDFIDEPYSSFEKRLPPPPPNGYSLDELERFARRFGAHTLALEANLDTLSRLEGRRACIAYLNQHFVVVSRIDESNDTISIIDPPLRYDRTVKQFRKAYSQRALIIAPEPIVVPSRGAGWRIALVGISAAAALGILAVARVQARRRRLAGALGAILALAMGGCRPAGEPGPATAQPEAEADAEPPVAVGARPGLRIEPTHYNAGKVFATSTDHRIHAVAKLFNDTDDTIHMIELRKNCVCTSISLENPTVSPHGSTSLQTSFSLGSTPGRDGAVITVFTSLPGDAGRNVSYEWELVTPLHIVPERYRFSRVDLGTPAAARLELWNRGVALCRQCEVHVEGVRNVIAAKLEDGPRATRVDHHVDGDISPGEDWRLGTILLDLLPQTEAGDVTRYVEIGVLCGGTERAKLSVPVDVSIRPRIEVRPPRLWLGLSPPGKTLKRRVLVRANDGTNLRIKSVNTKSGPIHVRGSFPAESGIERSIDLTLVAPELSGTHRGELEIETDGDAAVRRLILPVSLMVRRE